MNAKYKLIDTKVLLPKVITWELQEKIKDITIEAGYNPVVAKIEFDYYSDELITTEQEEIIEQYIEGLYEVIEELKIAREKRSGQTLYSCMIRCKTKHSKKIRDEYILPALEQAGFDRLQSGDSYCYVILSSKKEEARSIIETLRKIHQAELTWTFSEII